MHSWLLFLGVFLYSLSASCQLDKFRNPGSFNDIHTVYEFNKSNWDGTHSSNVFLYIADSNKLESFKWAEGDEEATLVSADIDWKKFSVRQFENYKLRKAKAPELVARLKQSGERMLKIEVKEILDSLLIADLPWQSYDFDFAGLSLIWRALINKKDSFWFHVADVGLVNGQPKFVNKGKVTVKFSGNEMINNKECFKYFADGVGLENKGGYIWVNQQTFMIEQYNIALPDEPGFQNGMMQLLKTHKMSPEQWESFKRKRLGE